MMDSIHWILLDTIQYHTEPYGDDSANRRMKFDIEGRNLNYQIGSTNTEKWEQRFWKYQIVP